MEIKKTIREFIMTELLAGQAGFTLSDATSLIDSGVVDSLGIMALLSFIEEKFSIQITGEELLPENFESVMKITALVAQKAGRSMEGFDGLLVHQ